MLLMQTVIQEQFMNKYVLIDVPILGQMLELAETVDRLKPQPAYTLSETHLLVFSFVQTTQKHAPLVAPPARSKIQKLSML
jgi:hypothetical protein